MVTYLLVGEAIATIGIVMSANTLPPLFYDRGSDNLSVTSKRVVFVLIVVLIGTLWMSASSSTREKILRLLPWVLFGVFVIAVLYGLTVPRVY